jgi:hypothetical protein
MTREKAFSNLIFEETNPFEFRSSFVLGCRYIIPKKSVIK